MSAKPLASERVTVNVWDVPDPAFGVTPEIVGAAGGAALVSQDPAASHPAVRLL